MILLFAFARRSRSMDRLMNLVREKDRMFLKEVKTAVGKSYYQQQLVKRLYTINYTLSQLDPHLYFLRPGYARHPQTGRIETVLQRHLRIQVFKNLYYFFLVLELEQDLDAKAVGERLETKPGNPNFSMTEKGMGE